MGVNPRDTVDVPPGRVWPSIVQMGFPAHRAGWYTPYWPDRPQWAFETAAATRFVTSSSRYAWVTQ